MTPIEIAKIYVNLVNLHDETPEEESVSKDAIGQLRSAYHHLLMDVFRANSIPFFSRAEAMRIALEMVETGTEDDFDRIEKQWEDHLRDPQSRCRQEQFQPFIFTDRLLDFARRRTYHIGADLETEAISVYQGYDDTGKSSSALLEWNRDWDQTDGFADQFAAALSHAAQTAREWNAEKGIQQ